MKIIFNISLFFVCFLFLFSCATLNIATYTERFEILIVDRETGVPIPDIIVYYQVTKLKPVHFIETEFEPIIQEKFITDENGCIVIEKKEIYLGFREFIAFETFYINIDSTKKNDIVEVIEEVAGYFSFGYPAPQYLLYHDLIFPNQTYNPARIHIGKSYKGAITTIQGDDFFYEPIDYTLKKKPQQIVIGLPEMSTY